MGLQSLMRQFSIRMRMIGAIGIVLSLLVLVGVSGLWGMQRMSSLGDRFMNHAFAETVTLSQLRLALADMSRHEKDMVIHYESPEQLSLAHMRWEQSLKDARAHIATLSDGEQDEDNRALQGVEQKLNAYVTAVEPVVAACTFADGSFIDEWAIAYYSGDTVRGIDLATVFRFDPESVPAVFGPVG